jgi:hypothetical protein
MKDWAGAEFPRLPRRLSRTRSADAVEPPDAVRVPGAGAGAAVDSPLPLATSTIRIS